MTTYADHRVDWLSGPEGLVARRSWELLPAQDTVLLRGLLGFPWRGRNVQARCTETEYTGHIGITGRVRVGRHHAAVPAAGCTCGIYALEEPEADLTKRGFLSRQVLVHGFVRLSGRVLFDGVRYRAERARIEGPLVIAVPVPGRLVGRSRPEPRVYVESGRYRVTYAAWGRAIRGSIDLRSWHEGVADLLTARYGVEVEEPASIVPA